MAQRGKRKLKLGSQCLFKYIVNQCKTPVLNNLVTRTAEKWFLECVYDKCFFAACSYPCCPQHRNSTPHNLISLPAFQQGTILDIS